MPETASKLTKGIYRHYKGNLYQVIDLAKHSESLDYMVVYRALYGDFELWVRPLQIFTQEIEVEGKLQMRFELVSDARHCEHSEAIQS